MLKNNEGPVSGLHLCGLRQRIEFASVVILLSRKPTCA